MVKLDDVLKELGPNAAILFASYIFMGFLQARYDSSMIRYREAIGEYRSNTSEDRAASLKDQIQLYRHRCKIMQWATLCGMVAAILLIASLLFACANVMIPGTPYFDPAGIVSVLVGFALLIVSSSLLIAEGGIVPRQLDNELRDISGLNDM